MVSQATAKVLGAVRPFWESFPRASFYCAVSGGLDSVVLLEALVRLGEERKRGSWLTVLHVNHNLRGEESKGEEEFVRSLAEARGLSFRSETLSWENARPSQAECRKRRLAFFLRQGHPEDPIFLAHHRDDQTETVLLHLLRGSGLRGLRGMALQNGRMIRPFLLLPKQVLAEAARDWELRWKEDSSNASTRYERNWIRLELLPLLEARKPGFSGRIACLAEEVRATFREGSPPSGFGERGAWSVFRRRDLERCSSSVLSSCFGLDRPHTRRLEELLEKAAGKLEAKGARFSLSQGMVLLEEGASLPEPILRKKGQEVSVETALGSWKLLPKEGQEVGFAGNFGGGERLKKAYQDRRVPTFFRGHLPLLRERDETRIIFPSDDPGIGQGVASPLARWWLSPS